MDRVLVLGAGWCGDTQATLAHLREVGVECEYRDVDEDAGADEAVRGANGGKRKLPTVMVGAEVLSVPGDEELDRALREHGMMG